MDDESVCLIDSPSSSEADDNDDVDYSPTAPRGRKAGTKSRAPAPKKAAAKRAATPRRKQPELIDLVSPPSQGTNVQASNAKATPAAGRKRKLGAGATKSETPNGSEEAEAKPVKRARTDLPDYIPLEGPMRVSEQDLQDFSSVAC
ncbi:hypothetical protein MTO96_039952 [Rhipicephalus appendiculatus]